MGCNYFYSVGKARVYICEAKSADDEEQGAYQFLMGLNETYVQTRSNILMMKPLPSVGTMYTILLTDEKQRHVYVGTLFFSIFASFNAGVSKPSFSPNFASSNAGMSKPRFSSRVFFDSLKASVV